jgi:hypothetical protein
MDSEPRYFACLWKHWKALMSGVISILFSAGQYAASTWFPYVQWPRSFPEAKFWALIGFGCIFYAAYSAWKDERNKVIHLRQELAAERDNLSGCPKIVLQQTGLLGEYFKLYNSGSDGRAVSLDRMGTPNYVLASDFIPYIKARETVRLQIYAHPKTDNSVNSRIEGTQAWKVITEDLWNKAYPPGQGLSLLQQYEKVATELLGHHLLIPLDISYSDLSGKKYKSPAVVSWDHAMNQIVEVRPGIIVRDLDDDIA